MPSALCFCQTSTLHQCSNLPLPLLHLGFRAEQPYCSSWGTAVLCLAHPWGSVNSFRLGGLPPAPPRSSASSLPSSGSEGDPSRPKLDPVPSLLKALPWLSSIPGTKVKLPTQDLRPPNTQHWSHLLSFPTLRNFNTQEFQTLRIYHACSHSRLLHTLFPFIQTGPLHWSGEYSTGLKVGVWQIFVEWITFFKLQFTITSSRKPPIITARTTPSPDHLCYNCLFPFLEWTSCGYPALGLPTHKVWHQTVPSTIQKPLSTFHMPSGTSPSQHQTPSTATSSDCHPFQS